MGEEAQKLISAVRDALGAVAALGLVVYLTGGAIVGLRLAAAKLPTTAVVGQLPRNVLISVGLAEGLLPTLILGAAYMGARSLIYTTGEQPNFRCRMGEMWGGKAGASGARTWHILWTAAAAGVILAPAVVSAVVDADSPFHHNRAFFWEAIAVIAVLTWLVMLLYVNMRARIVKRYGADMPAVRPTVLHSLLVVLALVPGSIAFWSMRPLEHAVACLTRVPSSTSTSAAVSGYLVGETGDHVYIGQMSGDHPSLISLPTNQVRQVITGQSAGSTGCS